MFDFSITERMYLDPKSSGEAARADCLATKICMATRFIIDGTCAISWVGLARGAGPSGREIAWIGDCHNPGWATHVEDCIVQVIGKMYLNICALVSMGD